ncbi:MAG: ribose-phosphate pyrophosphokinase [Ruminococcaceae bacterium]|nr:ribose-phosphate pyrophosphokinase [Oscillospiraceae bacterium]
MDKITSENVFKLEANVAPLRIISMNGAQELGKKIEDHLLRWAHRCGKEEESFSIEVSCPRFSSGDAKGLIKESIRGTDLYILVDVGNYNCKYSMYGFENAMSPDDHYQDLRRIIQATSGKAHRINVIMPNLYGGRQHRRSYRESLDCAVALQELQAMGVDNIVTFDAHDPRVCNAVPMMGFDNMMPSYQVMKAMFRDIPNLRPDPQHLMVVSPDEGALNRNMYYAVNMGVEMGMFYKRRDYSRIVNGRNPIVAHEYLGTSVEGKDIFIADDIIASGESMLDIAYELKKRKANRIFAYATYAIFTAGLEKMDKAVADGVLDGVFGTNLTYRTPELLQRDWFHEVDCSKYVAYYIAALNHNISITSLIDSHDKIQNLLTRYRGE